MVAAKISKFAKNYAYMYFTLDKWIIKRDPSQKRFGVEDKRMKLVSRNSAGRFSDHGSHQQAWNFLSGTVCLIIFQGKRSEDWNKDRSSCYRTKRERKTIQIFLNRKKNVSRLLSDEHH